MTLKPPPQHQGVFAADAVQEDLDFIGACAGVTDDDQGFVQGQFVKAPAYLVIGDAQPKIAEFLAKGSTSLG